ncbi:multidrug efflux SMR transporter [Blastococcus sp. Marseille-P5729]|uniref:DMT family transporter n=1 Tax=Blastococcus sp. Marseille-P5729 TaxID=2086582 RepID=UPI000D10C000|nr:multidrug efflux SMR transporter [Blastococcus sp. Marseille-P5729]
MSPWFALTLAGVFEVGFTTCLKLEQRNKRWFWGFLACVLISFGLLAEAIKSIPMGTAYAVWTGIGAVGTVLVSALLFKERPGPKVYAVVGVVIALIVGLKLVGE